MNDDDVMCVMCDGNGECFRLGAQREALLAALKGLDDAVMRYGLSKDRSDEEWATALSGLFAALKVSRAAIAQADAP